MARCETCGNEYDKAFTVEMNGTAHLFDSFECAIRMLAPRCKHCDNRIIGHGIEAGSDFFCGAHCAHSEGVATAVDRV